MDPHTSFPTFFFFDVCVPLQHPLPLPLRTRHFLFFSFWRVQCGSLGFLGVDPHTPFPTFFFFGVCMPLQHPLPQPLRTRHFLLFSFWRVQCGSLGFLGVDPHTPFSAFSFLTCACPFSTHFPCRSAHAISYFHAFYSRLFIFIHIFSFLLLTSVNIRDNMCANKNERRCFYVY